MSIFDGKISYGKYKGEDVTILEGYFGENMERILKYYLNNDKHKALFTEVYVNKIVFYRYFTLEVYEMFTRILVEPLITLSFNRKAVRDIVNQLHLSKDLKHMQHTGMEQETINEAKKYAHNMLNYLNIKRRMNYGILPHQEILFEEYEFLKFVNNLRGMVLAADPGTGKTFSSLALAEALDVERVIVIAPAGTLETVWVDSITGEMYKKPQKFWLSTKKEPYYGERFIICHYEFMGKLAKMLENDGKRTMFIIDESHNMNEKGTTRDKNFTALLDSVKPEDVLLLSGTAIKGSTMEVSNLLKATDVKFTPKIEEVFEYLYKSPNAFLIDILPMRYKEISTFVSKGSMGLPPSSTEELIMKLKNGDYYTLEKITERMREYGLKQLEHYTNHMDEYMETYTRLRNKATEKAIRKGIITEEDLHEYIDKVELIMRLYVEGGLADIPKIIREVNAFERLAIDPFNKGQDLHDFRNVATIVKYVSWKIQGEILARVVMRTRIDLAIDFAKEMDYKKVLTMTEKKTLFFSAYGEVCETAYHAISKHTGCGRIYWDYVPDISKTVKAFHKDKNMQALVATYKSVSAGVPITAANLTVFFDLPFKTYVYGQAIARTHRLGQDKPCLFLQLLLDTGEKDNINSRNVDIIQLSKDMVEVITQKEVNLEFKKIGGDDDTEVSTEDEIELRREEAFNITEMLGLVGQEQDGVADMLFYDSFMPEEFAYKPKKVKGLMSF